MNGRITLEDIARQTGVSLATVSLVLRNKPGINDDTRQRVLTTARSLGYHRRAPPELPTSGLQQIAVLVKTRAGNLPMTNQFYAPILASIEVLCRKQQINMLYATVPVDIDNHPVEIPRMLLDGRLDGVLLLGAFVDHTINQLAQQRHTSLVLVDAYATTPTFDSVISDNFRGAYEAVSYLIQRGHREIGLVGALADNYPSMAERRRGYLQALHDQQITNCYFADSQYTRDDAIAAITALLKRSPHITALFCSTDELALAAIQACRSMGKNLPDDLSIIGFDDIDLAEHIAPALTTMRVDKMSMGRMALHLLDHRVETPDAAWTNIVLMPKLIERQSVRPLPCL